MITVKISRDAERRIVAFHVKGHANSAPHGQDLICGAVSALTQSAALGIGQYLRRPHRLQAGNGLFLLALCGSPDAQTDAVLETMLLGLREIAALGAGFVRIVDK